MLFIPWQPAMSMGIEALDEEHRLLIGMINSLHEQWASGDAREKARETLMEMRRYAFNHFQHEEGMMLADGYPRLEEHQAQHEGFRVRLRHFEELAHQGKESPSDVLTFLSDWLTNHILASDRDYARFVRSKA